MDDQRASDSRFGLPRYVRFARSLALVSGLTRLGIAVGATVFTASVCTGCTGVAPHTGSSVGTGGIDGTGGAGASGGIGGFIDAATGGSFDGGNHPDHFVDGHASDGDALDGPAVDARTGGPLPAPPFPAAWLA